MNEQRNHIVKSYDEEQNALLDELIRMGRMSVAQLDAALDVVERRDDKAAERACLLFQDAAKIAWYAQSFGGVHPMEQKDVDFIRGWEVEKFRSGVAASGLTTPSSESAPILKK